MEVRSFAVRVVLNSKAEPTLEVCVNGFCASPPSGTSRSSKEVEPWPDGRTLRERVEKAKRTAEEILAGLKGEVDPLEVERELLPEKHSIGGNTLLAVSIPLYKAAAAEEGLPLFLYLSKKFGLGPGFPRPLENVVGGGKHGGGSDVQEFLLFPSFDASPEEHVLTLAEAYKKVKEELKKVDAGFTGCLTLESAWVTSLGVEDVLGVLSKVAEEYDLSVGMDMAASEMYRGGSYVWEREGVVRDREAQIDYMEYLANTFGIRYLEDPLHEDDVEGFKELQRRLPETIVTGDDLFATDAQRLVKGIGGVIIKYNQRGSVVEAVETVKRARELGIKAVVSHRSGETEDNFLTHFAVAVGSDLFKAGAAGIRVVKLNELVRISGVYASRVGR